MRLLWFLVAIVLLTYGVYYFVRTVALPSPPERIGAEKIMLSKPTQVVDSVTLKAAWMNTSGSTLLFFIFPEIKDRTAVVGNEYATAIQIGSKEAFKILISPDAGRGNMLAPAIFEVFVNGKNESEVIDVTNVPLQKWSFVAIVKQGRKFNIYVNGELSTSHVCTAMPDYDETQPLRVGDVRLGGKVALMSLAPYAMQIDEVQTLARDTMSTDHKPYLSSDMPMLPEVSLPSLANVFTCPGGNCTKQIKASPFDQWKSLYA
jgi:hypothetical protein